MVLHPVLEDGPDCAGSISRPDRAQRCAPSIRRPAPASVTASAPSSISATTIRIRLIKTHEHGHGGPHSRGSLRLRPDKTDKALTALSSFSDLHKTKAPAKQLSSRAASHLCYAAGLRACWRFGLGFLGEVFAGGLIDLLHRQAHLAAIVEAQQLDLHGLAFLDHVATAWRRAATPVRETWTRPSLGPKKFTKAPKSITLTILPS